MRKLDISMTACKRPIIIRQTLESFALNLLDNISDVNTRLFINIDPAGDLDVDPDEIVDLCYDYVDEVIYNAPEKASFAKAFKWCWNQLESDIVLNLEDDWILLRKIDFNDVLKTFFHNDDMAVLRLPWKRTDQVNMKNWKFFYPYKNKYFECPEEHKHEVGFCGHPSFIRMEFLKEARKILRENANPEKQFHERSNSKMIKLIDQYRFGVYGYPNQDPAIADIGRQWMIENKLCKKGNKAYFLNWSSTKEN